MNVWKRSVMVLALLLAAVTGLWAQRPGGGMGMMTHLPPMPGLQNPTVGSGSEYLITTKGREMDIATVALGKEDVEGGTGFWMEQRLNSTELGGEMVMKSLTLITGTQAGIKRMIMQQPGKPPIEMTGMMMSMMQRSQSPSTQPAGGAAGNANMGELVGTETITVPAGTFSCQHYRKQDINGPVDIWTSPSVSPYSVVKLTGTDMTMVLKKTLSGETSHIKGEPQKVQMPQLPQF